ncbi:hypothetical protein C1645_509273 [Glomus cerebriforme]|uniref:Granulins domain-containing protein n=1 Tax=Glomus cerebriforme TaxID=658196 RepID=A0A397SIK7_9GLOM|nr:hypothetical protein C1645_509273 [Glomus cerebriforme]
MMKKLVLILVLAILTFSAFTSATPTKFKRYPGTLRVSKSGKPSSLVKRQSMCPTGFDLCPNDDGCCPTGSICEGNICANASCGFDTVDCGDGTCCYANTICTSDGRCE